MSIRAQVFAGVGAALLIASSAHAQNTTANNTNPINVASISTFDAFFDELTGMTVSWTYEDGTTGSGTWKSLGGGTFGVVDPGGTRTDQFSLTAAGGDDTYNFFDPFLWDLDAKNLKSFSIDPTTALYNLGGTNVSAVFDTLAFPQTGTNGSSYGLPFNYGACFIGCFETSDQWNTLATYTNPVSVNGVLPAHDDLYGVLDVTFGKKFSGDVNFSQDLDLVTGAPDSQVTPEPGSLTLLAGGLAGMVAAAKRRRRR